MNERSECIIWNLEAIVPPNHNVISPYISVYQLTKEYRHNYMIQYVVI